MLQAEEFHRVNARAQTQHKTFPFFPTHVGRKVRRGQYCLGPIDDRGLGA